MKCDLFGKMNNYKIVVRCNLIEIAHVCNAYMLCSEQQKPRSMFDEHIKRQKIENEI